MGNKFYVCRGQWVKCDQSPVQKSDSNASYISKALVCQYIIFAITSCSLPGLANMYYVCRDQRRVLRSVAGACPKVWQQCIADFSSTSGLKYIFCMLHVFLKVFHVTKSARFESEKKPLSLLFLTLETALPVPETKIWDLFWNQDCYVVMWQVICSLSSTGNWFSRFFSFYKGLFLILYTWENSSFTKEDGHHHK